MDASIKKKILIVDDEPSLREALKANLAHEHFTVFEAKDGVEGLQVALREHPDLILLDLIMPHVNGVMMLGQLREDLWGKSAKVIALTNLDETTSAAEMVELGVTDYLVKADWKIGEVIAKIREKLA